MHVIPDCIPSSVHSARRKSRSPPLQTRGRLSGHLHPFDIESGEYKRRKDSPAEHRADLPQRDSECWCTDAGHSRSSAIPRAPEPLQSLPPHNPRDKNSLLGRRCSQNNETSTCRLRVGNDLISLSLQPNHPFSEKPECNRLGPDRYPRVIHPSPHNSAEQSSCFLLHSYSGDNEVPSKLVYAGPFV